MTPHGEISNLGWLVECADPNAPITWVYNDGGRKEAGFHAKSGDCACRAIAIATGMPYLTVHRDLVAMLLEKGGKRAAALRDRYLPAAGRPLHGYHNKLANKYMERLGWKWTATMGIGTGCRVHLRRSELPMGRIIVRLSGHWAAVINQTLHDTHDCSRGGTRCVYGYWSKGTEGAKC